MSLSVINVDNNVPHNNGPLKIWYFQNVKLVNNLYTGWHLSTRAHPYDVATDKYKLELIRKNILKYTFPTADAEFMQEGPLYEQSAKAVKSFSSAIENLKEAYRQEIQSTPSKQTRFVYFRLSEDVILTKGITSPKSVNGVVAMKIVPMKPYRKTSNGMKMPLTPYASLSWEVILEGSEKPLGACAGLRNFAWCYHA